jgi:hypothetical protein
VLSSLCARELCSCIAIAATMNKEKLMKMASAVRTGGKGSVRRYVASGSLHFVCFFLPRFLLLCFPLPVVGVL